MPSLVQYFGQTDLWPWGVMEIQIKESTLKHMQKREGMNTLSGKSSLWISQSLWFCGNVKHFTCLFSLVFSKHFNYFYLHTIV